MARCAVIKLFLFAAPLLGAGDKTSGDDEASFVPLTVGHAVSHAPSQRPQMPFGGPLGVVSGDARRSSMRRSDEK
jgi:hypothetical protein